MHAYTSEQFVMLDAYIYAHNPSKNSLLILGDGKLPMKYHTATSYEADLVCDFGGGIGKVPAKVLLMSGGKVKTPYEFIAHTNSEELLPYNFV